MPFVLTFTDLTDFSRNVPIIKAGNFLTTTKQLWWQLTVTCFREIPRNCTVLTTAEQWLYVNILFTAVNKNCKQ
jgi:hypothetical protein